LPPDEFDYAPLSQVDLDEFTGAFNRAYRDYFVPTVLSVPALRALVERDDIALESSVAALHGGRIVGMGLLGVRGREGWIGGMGVIPSHRRQGIGRALMRRLLDQARARGLEIVRLEVIEPNQPARALYVDLGFEEVRRLLVLQREPESPPASVDDRYAVAPAPVPALLAYYNAFHDVRNCWQRGRRSLAGLADQMQGWAARDGEEIVGYAVGWASRGEVRLADLGVHPAADRPAVAGALLGALHRANPGAYGAHYNVAEDEPTLPAYRAAGYATRLVQIEMEWRPDAG